MLIGIISDTHDNLFAVEKAINRLNQEKVELVLHAGDYVSPFIIPKFETLNCKFIGVFGNNDGDHEFLKKKFLETRNCEIHGRFTEVFVDNFRIALLHGEETELLNTLIRSQYFDAVIHGHSHSNVSEIKGKTLSINPGEVCGYLTGKSTIMILDTAKKETSTIQL